MQLFPTKEGMSETKEELKNKRKYTVIFCSSFLAFMIVMGVIVFFLEKNSFVEYDFTAYSAVESSDEVYSSNIKKMNINYASKKDIMSIEGIGEKTADSILAYRYKYGKFISLDELADIDGIGEATVEKLKSYFTV